MLYFTVEIGTEHTCINTLWYGIVGLPRMKNIDIHVALSRILFHVPFLLHSYYDQALTINATLYIIYAYVH